MTQAGSAALLMEWGITRKNDPFLYGEKVKAYLIKGAKPLGMLNNPVNMTVPNSVSGWGTLCLKDALPFYNV